MRKEEVQLQKFHHSVDIQIRFNDLDINGHVNNGVYHSYFDLGRMHFFNDVLREKTRTTLIAQVNTTYVKPLLIDDKICIKTKVIRWGNSSFDVLQAIFKQNSDFEELANYNITTFVYHSNEKPAPIPEEWKTRVAEFEK